MLPFRPVSWQEPCFLGSYCAQNYDVAPGPPMANRRRMREIDKFKSRMHYGNLVFSYLYYNTSDIYLCMGKLQMILIRNAKKIKMSQYDFLRLFLFAFINYYMYMTLISSQLRESGLYGHFNPMIKKFNYLTYGLIHILDIHPLRTYVCRAG